MKPRIPFFLLLVASLFTTVFALGSLREDVKPLVDAACMACHNGVAIAPLDMANLGYDLTDSDTYHSWERIYERIVRGEMPPAGIPLPSDEIVDKALSSLESALTEQNLRQRNGKRVPLRRLTQLEYAYTLHDLLRISERDSLELSSTLPAEAATIGFNTIAANQGISALHVKSYLEVANKALDKVLLYGSPPPRVTHKIDYSKSSYLAFAAYGKLLGFGIVKRLSDAYVAFFDGGSTYMFHSEIEGYQVPHAGWYKVSVDVYPYQAKSPVTLTVYRGRKAGIVASLDDLIGVFDLTEPQVAEVSTYLVPGDLIGVSVADLQAPPGPYVDYYHPDRNVQHYKGEGIAFKSLSFEGPLYETWPPEGTQRLLKGLEFDDAGQVILTKRPYDHIVDVVTEFASRAFRRPLREGEAEMYASLAEPLIAENRPFLDALRLPLRAILSAPTFLYLSSDEATDEQYVLATRLSYFLWRSMPDDELIALASSGKLSDPDVLTSQVERLLDDPKAQRFIRDFAGQAFRLYELKATTPDTSLYPEYDDRLGQAIGKETEMFLAELVEENHCVDKLVDADFTFVNRRLAEHYGINGVEGQHMRRIAIPEDSPRGGLITQASVHKVTANGTITSPVPRGNYVLENILGTPVPPPPPGVAGLEPDTRGTTTIREMLTAHRNEPVCAGCHQTIDPPGFALESFDPIGGFRSKYRISGPKFEYDGVFYPGPYQEGPEVDPSGITPQGKSFADINEYKDVLKLEVDQIARHFVSQLFAFATGAEVQFADRAKVESVLERVAVDEYPVRNMIHEVVQSDLFTMR